jgi:hypothetical protein
MKIINNSIRDKFSVDVLALGRTKLPMKGDLGNKLERKMI